MYLLGYDIGSSSVKAALVEVHTGKAIGTAQHPEQEMDILAERPDWAEQHPSEWWQAVCAATRKLLTKTGIVPGDIAAIGISYQMHGLVVVDKKGEVLRPAIIWCDSRAVGIGNRAFEKIGESYCLEHYLNAPGNFTASKLRWVCENEPGTFSSIHKFMLPGDYIAYRMTGEIRSTVSGLSEGVLWDFKEKTVARQLLEHYEIPEKMLPDPAPVFSKQGMVTAEAAAALGLVPGIPVGYRAGDQPNNALSLNVLRPGEVAATGGTSGVVYAVAGQPMFDARQRVNSFAHVNYTPENPLTGVLLCINGAGSQYRWMRQHIGSAGLGYQEMEQLAASAGVGADGVCILPFGNGAERMLGNCVTGSRISGLHFNRHEKRHLYRAALEGIAFSFVYGIEIMQQMGIPVRMLRAGNDNLFQSAVFSNTLSTLVGAEIELIATTGAVGAAKAAGVSVGIYDSIEEAMQEAEIAGGYEPSAKKDEYELAFEKWKKELAAEIGTLDAGFLEI
ncbi:MAG: carbohydrate kinase [Haliscomenobacteraceae bacterium CHB4]|nr:carbohydrate kinase [Haliscomenobacteraceae bacterium CHB4]